MWLCEGQLYSAGYPQYGQLGHGTDHEYNAKDCELPLSAYTLPLQVPADRFTAFRNGTCARLCAERRVLHFGLSE